MCWIHFRHQLAQAASEAAKAAESNDSVRPAVQHSEECSRNAIFGSRSVRLRISNTSLLLSPSGSKFYYSSRFATGTARTQGIERKEAAGILGRTKSRLKLGRWDQSWAEQESSWDQLGPSLAPSRTMANGAPTKPANLSAHSESFQRLARVGPNLGLGWPQKPNLCPNCAIGPNWSPSWHQVVMLGWSWARSDPDEPDIEAISCAMRNLGPCHDSSAPSLGPPGAQHGEHCFLL